MIFSTFFILSFAVIFFVIIILKVMFFDITPEVGCIYKYVGEETNKHTIKVTATNKLWTFYEILDPPANVKNATGMIDTRIFMDVFEFVEENHEC